MVVSESNTNGCAEINNQECPYPRLHGRLGKGSITSVKFKGGNELLEFPYAPFQEHFKSLIDNVISRVQRLHDLEQTNCNSLDREVYAETVISQIAAICIENPKHDDNYTLQNCLRRLKKSDLVIPVEDVLGRILCVDCDGTKISVRDCIKTLRNKFVCHYDNFDDYDVSGNESTGDGKWTLSDKHVIIDLLFPRVSKGPIDELIMAMSTSLHTARQCVTTELLSATFKVAAEIITQGGNR